MNSPAPLLQIERIRKYFPVKSGLLRRKTADLKAVDDVSFSLGERETLGLVGESGCGKSTLAQLIMRLYTPTAGQVKFRDVDIASLTGQSLRVFRQHVQMIFQDSNSSLNPRHTIGHIIAEPLKLHRAGTSRHERVEQVEALLTKVGLSHEFVTRYPHELSGGQRQRVAIARAISIHPAIIVCDEPVSALDASIQAQILNLLRDLQDNLGLSYLFIAHDLSVVSHMCSHVAVMYLGRIVEKAPAQKLFNTPRHPYTEALLRAVPRIGRGRLDSGNALSGDLPSPLSPPSGCPFHPRCPQADPECRAQVPELRSLSGNPEHWVSCLKVDTH